MDVEGARHLRARIDERQHEHWQQARAVREGRQDPVDPDGEHLVRCHDDVREYEPEYLRDEFFCQDLGSLNNLSPIRV